VPWDDLRYIFGEIMYGGHIVEDWDRRLANAYLFKYFNETLLEGMEMFPAFFTPANTMTHKQVSVQALHKTAVYHSCNLCFEGVTLQHHIPAFHSNCMDGGVVVYRLQQIIRLSISEAENTLHIFCEEGCMP